ncbi:MAG: S8 family peptidase, partial [Bacteroidales bacterium]
MKTNYIALINIFIFIQCIAFGQALRSYDFNLEFFNGYYISIIGSDTTKIDTSLIVVKYIEDILMNEISEIEEQYNLTAENISSLGFYTYLMPRDSMYIPLAQKINDDPKVQYFQMNFELKYHSLPNDELSFNQWYLETIEGYKGWEIEMGKSNIRVAVIGSGVYWDHEDLGPGQDGYENIYHNPGEDDWQIWNDPSTGDGCDGICNTSINDPNEKVDDWKGYEFTLPSGYSNNDSRPNVGSFYEDHETLVAGIIAAKTNNGIGVSGIAGGNHQMGISVIPIKLGDNLGIYWAVPLRKAIDYAINGLEPRADIIQLSLGNQFYYDAQIDVLLNNFYEYPVLPNNTGGLTIASSGNSTPYANWVAWPAIRPWVISVTATDQDDFLAPFGVVYHPYEPETLQIEIAAPGMDIYSTSSVSNGVSNYGWGTGSSFSSPMVSATAGLIWSANPSLSNFEVREILQNSADKVHDGLYNYDFNPTYPGLSEELGFGRLNVYNALKMAIDCQLVTPIVINTDITWEENKLLTGDIIINTGNTLTINGNVFMADDTKIVVQNGAELIINNGLISNSEWCGNNGTWYGIEVWGNVNSPFDSEQGKVIIKNGGEIRNSQAGIYAYRPGLDPSFAFYKGGIVQASNAIFRNNGVTVSLYDYSYVSKSSFKDCLFIYDDDYINENPFQRFVYLKNMNGIGFINCKFINESLQNYIGKGIDSYNSRFTVDGKCLDPLPSMGDCREWAYSEFNNLMYGVYAVMTTSAKNLGIKRTNFVANQKGVFIGGTTSAQVVRCNFKIPGLVGLAYGLYLERSTAYQVEENNFFNSSPANNGYIGLYVNHSGGNPNEIYNNVFYNLDYAFVSLNQNRGLADGLKIKCNEFTDCNSDISVLKNMSGTYMGISPNQGSSGFQANAPAGDRFSWTGPVGTPTDINNQANHFNYYYHVDDNYRLKPEFFTVNTVNIIANPDAPWSLEGSCPSNLGGSGGHLDDQVLKSMMVTYANSADSLSLLIQDLEDSGNTQTLKWEIDLSVPQQALQVYNQIMSVTPFVSDTVMAAAIEKESVLIDAMIRDVMVASPESAKDDKLLEKLDNRFNPIPDYMLGQILQGRSLVSAY